MQYIFLLISSYLLINNSSLYKKEDSIYKYDVNSINEYHIKVDGIFDKNIWDKSKELDDFSLPWNDEIPQKTLFRALYDTNNLYMYFEVIDKNLVIKDSIKNEIEIASEDRIEFYLSKDSTMKLYFCFEIDPLGRLLDYSASYYRMFDNSWNVNGVRIASNHNSEGYQIEVEIPLISIKEMGIDVSKDFYVGLYRADLEQSHIGINEDWQSWINPKTSTPDFHVSESLGKFHLIKKYQ